MPKDTREGFDKLSPNPVEVAVPYDIRHIRPMSTPPLKAAIVPVTPLQQNCSHS
jgi:hypothetical protein